jgi:hypothetical protein
MWKARSKHLTDTCRAIIVEQVKDCHGGNVKYKSVEAGIVIASDFSSPPLKREPGSASPALSILTTKNCLP